MGSLLVLSAVVIHFIMPGLKAFQILGYLTFGSSEVSNIRISNVWIFRGAAATRRRGQARNVRCSSKARHSRGSLQGLYIDSPVVSFESLPR